MIGGAPHNIERVEPLLRAMGKKVIHMGDNGKGLSAKLAQNMNIVFIYEGLCESLTLAKKLGVPAEKMFELIESSMIRSGVAEYKKPFILNQDYSPNFPLKLMHKDMHLMMDAAKENGVDLPGPDQDRRNLRRSQQRRPRRPGLCRDDDVDRRAGRVEAEREVAGRS